MLTQISCFYEQMIIFSRGLVLLHVKLPQWCPTSCDPVHYSPPGSSVHEIHQARILESVAMLFSWGWHPGVDLTQQSNPGSLTSPTVAGGLFSSSATCFFKSDANLFKSDLIKGQGILIPAGAFSMLCLPWSCNLWKPSWDTCNRVRVEKVEFWQYCENSFDDLPTLWGTQIIL